MLCFEIKAPPSLSFSVTAPSSESKGKPFTTCLMAICKKNRCNKCWWCFFSEACHITDLCRNGHVVAKIALLLTCWQFPHPLQQVGRGMNDREMRDRQGLCRAGKAVMKLLSVDYVEEFIDLGSTC